MVKTKKTLGKEWKTRTPHFQIKKDSYTHYCVHWWNSFECDDHGDGITHSETYLITDGGWSKVMSLAKKCVDAGYRVSITRTGR